MSETALAPAGAPLDWNTLKAVVTAGDLGKLTDEQQTQYYIWRCEVAGLDPRARPFEYIELNRKLVLYATKAATDQLCEKRRLTVAIVGRERSDDLYIVTARATDPSGRYTEDVGVVVIAGQRGNDLANAIMKAYTKAKRRTVLSLCGLGAMDESEVEGVPVQAASPPPRVDTATGEVLGPAMETEEAALKRTGDFVHAQAREAGIDTKDRPAMHRVCAEALGREVPTMTALDAGDRATVAFWIKANPQAARNIAHPPKEDEEPATLAGVTAAEVHPTYAQAKGF